MTPAAGGDDPGRHLRLRHHRAQSPAGETNRVVVPGTAVAAAEGYEVQRGAPMLVANNLDPQRRANSWTQVGNARRLGHGHDDGTNLIALTMATRAGPGTSTPGR